MKNNGIIFIVSSAVLLALIFGFASSINNEHVCTGITKCSVSEKRVEMGSLNLRSLFSTEGWPPRWSCGEWSPTKGWTSIISDLIIFLSYFGIPAALVFFIVKARVKDITFKSLLLLFVTFIVCCGLTHLIDAIIFWKPMYNLSIVMKFITAAVSATTLFALVRNTPQLLSFKSPRQLNEIIDMQTAELRRKNEALNEEIKERKKVEKEHKQALKLNEDLFKENQHRIKNNLQMISSLLFIKSLDKTEQEKKDFEEIGERISSISKVHELLLRGDLTANINAQQYFHSLAEEFKNIHESAGINLIVDIADELSLSSDYMINCGLIFSEFFSNSVKHAFTDHQKPEVILSLKQHGSTIDLVLSDNGSGFDTTKIPDTSFGIGLIETFAQNMNGTISINSSARKGTEISVRFDR